MESKCNCDGKILKKKFSQNSNFDANYIPKHQGPKKEFPRHGMYAYRIVATQFALQNQRLKRHDKPL